MRVTTSLIQVAITILEMSQEGDGRLWGYRLAKRSGVRSGVLYPQLDRLLREGWLADYWESQEDACKRPPRRYYELTDAGRIGLGAIAVRARSMEPQAAAASSRLRLA